MYQIWRIILIYEAMITKNEFGLATFGCKVGQSDPIVMQLKLDMLCHLLNVYTKFQIDISKHVGKKSGKLRTDRRCHGIIRPFFKRVYKNKPPHLILITSLHGIAFKMFRCLNNNILNQ